MSSDGQKPNDGVTAGPAVMPRMPPALEQLLLRMRASEVESAAAPAATEATSASTVGGLAASGGAVSTAELLQMIDDMYASFRDVAAHCALSSSPSPSLVSSTSTASDARAMREAAQERALTQSLAAFEEKVAMVQGGIRSKLHQTARLAIIAHLRSEIAARQHAITRLSMVLETAHKTLPPVPPNSDTV